MRNKALSLSYILALCLFFVFNLGCDANQASLSDLGTLTIPVNGICSDPLTNNICKAGTLSDSADTATKYLWACSGADGGSNAACELFIPINGSCGLTNNLCLTGTSSILPEDTATKYLWTCLGAHGGSNALTCELFIPINGSCGSANNSCLTGSSVDTPADTATHHRWTCNGAHSGSNAPTCTLEIPHFYVGIKTDDFIAHAHVDLPAQPNGGFDSSCRITLGTVANVDLNCIIEIPEGDLYAKKVELTYSVPPQMCRYLRRNIYWFYNHEVGFAPGVIVANIDNNFTTDSSVTPAVETYVNSAYSCNFDGGGADADCDDHPELTPTALTTTAVALACLYDKTTSGGPNCCFGSYAQQTNIDKNVLDTFTSITTTTSKSTTNTSTWNGTYTNCIGGPGKTDWDTYGPKGIPRSHVSYVYTAGVTAIQNIAAPLDFVLTRENSPSVHAANYYGGLFNYGGVVGVVDHRHTGFSGGGPLIDAPYFIAPIDDRNGTAISSTQDTYEFQCLDEGFEIKYRIRVKIRDWDTFSDYLIYIASGVAGGAVIVNPDHGAATEPGTNCESIPFAGYFCNDSYDIDDFLGLNLGSQTYNTTNILFRGNYFPQIQY